MERLIGEPQKLTAAAVLVMVLAVLEAWRAYHAPGAHGELASLAVAGFLVVSSVPLGAASGLPVAVVELLLGMLAALYGVEPGETVRVLSEIGANMVLFMAGTEIDVGLLRRRAGDALALAALIMAGPVGLAVLLAGPRGPWLLVSAAFAATSVALTYAILQSGHLLRTRDGQTVLAAAMITDVAGMIMLNLATAGASPLMLLYSAIILLAILLNPLLRRLGELGGEMEIRLVTMAIIVLGAATELLGVHSVLTSFILGVVVSDVLRERRSLREKLEGMSFGFFAPFFFVASGMASEPHAIKGSLALILGVGLLVFLLKFAPASLYLAARGSARLRRTRARLAAAAAPLLTVSIIAADIGSRAGLIGPGLYTLIMGSVVVTSLLAGLLGRGRG